MYCFLEQISRFSNCPIAQQGISERVFGLTFCVPIPFSLTSVGRVHAYNRANRNGDGRQTRVDWGQMQDKGSGEAVPANSYW